MNYSKDTLKEQIKQKLRLNYGCTEAQASDGEIMKSCAMVLRDEGSRIADGDLKDAEEKIRKRACRNGALHSLVAIAREEYPVRELHYRMHGVG